MVISLFTDRHDGGKSREEHDYLESDFKRMVIDSLDETIINKSSSVSPDEP